MGLNLSPDELVLATTAVKAGISALAKPIANATFNGLKSISSSVIDIFSDRLSEYTLQQHQRHSYISTIVFQHQKSLKDLYIPLTLTPANDLNKSIENKGILVDKFPNEIFKNESKILITDTAGMGKSTLSKFLFIECLNSNQAIPFFIELRHLTDKINVLDVITKQLNLSSIDDDEPRFPKKNIQRMLKKNDFLFFFDGYDEILPSHREAVTKNLKELIEIYPQHKYIITSRPESGLLAFPSFKQFKIKPLTRDESYNLIRKYDDGCGRSEQLIDTLQKGEYRPVREFLKNPLLCSLLYRCFEYKQSVPLKKHVFYRQVYDALYDWHDSSKDGYNTREKVSGLDIDAFHRILRVVGFYSVMTGKVEGDRDTVLGWIRRAKDVCHLKNLSESKLLEDLIRAVPLFVKDGELYRWSHKSLSEYFAAQYICTEGKSDQKRTLDAIMASKDYPRFSNMLDQIYDIDNNAFREYLILPVAKAFKEHWEISYRKYDPSIEDIELRLRRSICFDKKIFILANFNFKNINELKEKLRSIDVSLFSSPNDPEMMSLFLFESMAIVIIEGRHSFILNILSEKKDPLILRPEFVEISKSGRLPQYKNDILLTDDPKINFNTQENFSKINKQLIKRITTPNSENLLKFTEEFKGNTQLSNLTDELLMALKI